MTSANPFTETIVERLKTLTPQQQQEVIQFIEFLQFKTPSVRENSQPVSFYEASKEYIGCVDGDPGDLATNKEYLRNLGK